MCGELGLAASPFSDCSISDRNCERSDESHLFEQVFGQVGSCRLLTIDCLVLIIENLDSCVQASRIGIPAHGFGKKTRPQIVLSVQIVSNQLNPTAEISISSVSVGVTKENVGERERERERERDLF